MTPIQKYCFSILHMQFIYKSLAWLHTLYINTPRDILVRQQLYLLPQSPPTSSVCVRWDPIYTNNCSLVQFHSFSLLQHHVLCRSIMLEDYHLNGAMLQSTSQLIWFPVLSFLHPNLPLLVPLKGYPSVRATVVQRRIHCSSRSVRHTSLTEPNSKSRAQPPFPLSLIETAHLKNTRVQTFHPNAPFTRSIHLSKRTHVAHISFSICHLSMSFVFLPVWLRRKSLPLAP